MKTNILLRDVDVRDKEALKILAKINKRSINSEILIAIDKYLEDDEVYLLYKPLLRKGDNKWTD